MVWFWGLKLTRYIRALLVAGMLSVGFGVAIAGPLENGIAANQKGNYAKALAIFRPLAERGNAKAQLGLGEMYWFGRGVAKDEKKAAKLYQLAGEQGLADAQFVLGVIYDGGTGVAQDSKAAVKWFQLGAKQEHAGAQFALAVMYATGSGVTKDPVRAQMWFVLSAAHGAVDPNHWIDLWAKHLSKDQINRAQEMASHCEATKYKDCS